ncbi:hypothetical protein SAMN05216548_11456 [Faunimonas pinastri]|uniref:Uncharacterized protein n=1 Tax=Faunimonas pinastri TaxID=1855383 RepID=A0A1H9MUK2_9HYPH|nr:hypothetical protein [Faunimonas pinastri]SER27362.1 hypothetical protein SAMN05216548_11456 [Faunimonas pinastri]
MQVSDDQALVATKTFLVAMRREWVRRNPGCECPVKPLDEYSLADRQSLISSVKAAVRSTSEENMRRLRERAAENAAQQ